jgi:hypothetical protein
VRIPSSAAARIIRIAISPRLATSKLIGIIGTDYAPAGSLTDEENIEFFVRFEAQSKPRK